MYIYIYIYTHYYHEVSNDFWLRLMASTKIDQGNLHPFQLPKTYHPRGGDGLIRETSQKHISIDWFKGKITGTSQRNHGKIYGFRLRFPLVVNPLNIVISLHTINQMTKKILCRQVIHIISSVESRFNQICNKRPATHFRLVLNPTQNKKK